MHQSLIEKKSKFEEKLKDIFSLLESSHNLPLEDFLTQFQKIVEIIIWSEQNKTTFKIIEEKNFLDLLSQYFATEISFDQQNAVKLMKTYSFLVINHKQSSLLDYIVNHKTFDQIMNYDWDFSDDDFNFYYINFIKVIAQRVDTLQFESLYNQRRQYFPLFFNICKFYNHHDELARTTTFNIILNLLQSKHSSKIVAILIQYPFNMFFINFVTQVYYFPQKNLGQLIKNGKSNKFENIYALKERYQNQIELLNDFFQLNNQNFVIFMRNIFLSFFVCRFLNELIDCDTETVWKEPYSYIFFIWTYEKLRDKYLQKTITKLLFQQSIPQRLLDKSLNSIQPLIQYQSYSKSQQIFNRYLQENIILLDQIYQVFNKKTQNFQDEYQENISKKFANVIIQKTGLPLNLNESIQQKIEDFGKLILEKKDLQKSNFSKILKLNLCVIQKENR